MDCCQIYCIFLLLMAGYRTAAWNPFLLSLFFLFFFTILWKYRGSELYCCHAAIFCLSSLFFLLPPVYSLRILGFWLFLEKRGRGKGGWEADLLAWDFCGYFLLLFLIFYPLKTLFFGIFEKRDGKKRGKQGVFCWRFKHGNGEEKRGEREKKQEDFGWVLIWIYRELSKNYFL